MLSLSQFFIKSPKYLDDIKCCRCDRIWKVTTWWRDCSYNRYWACSRWRTETCYFSSSFIELCKLRPKMCWETLICWHFCKTSCNFSQSFCPSWCWISHQCNIKTHISEIFRQSNSSINRGFSCSDRHVRSVCDQTSSLHYTMLFTVNLYKKSWEFFKYFSHFISSFSTTDINNTLRVRIFWQCLRNTSFTTTKSSRNSTSSS